MVTVCIDTLKRGDFTHTRTDPFLFFKITNPVALNLFIIIHSNPQYLFLMIAV